MKKLFKKIKRKIARSFSSFVLDTINRDTYEKELDSVTHLFSLILVLYVIAIVLSIMLQLGVDVGAVLTVAFGVLVSTSIFVHWIMLSFTESIYKHTRLLDRAYKRAEASYRAEREALKDLSEDKLLNKYLG